MKKLFLILSLLFSFVAFSQSNSYKDVIPNKSYFSNGLKVGKVFYLPRRTSLTMLPIDDSAHLFAYQDSLYWFVNGQFHNLSRPGGNYGINQEHDSLAFAALSGYYNAEQVDSIIATLQLNVSAGYGLTSTGNTLGLDSSVVHLDQGAQTLAKLYQRPNSSGYIGKLGGDSLNYNVAHFGTLNMLGGADRLNVRKLPLYNGIFGSYSYISNDGGDRTFDFSQFGDTAKFQLNGTHRYTLPADSGTLALKSDITSPDLSGYQPALFGTGLVNSTDGTITYITNNSSNWNTAFGWGNHASAGYLTTTTGDARYPLLSGSYSNPSWITGLAWSKITGAPSMFSGDYNDLTNKPTIPTNNNQLANGAGYISDTSAINAQLVQARNAIATKLNIADTSYLYNQIAANTVLLASKADSNNVKPAMVTVGIGNSIMAQSQYSTSFNKWFTNATVQWANALSGSAMYFKKMTAGTRVDQNGIYAYSSQSLATILTDIETNWYTPLQNAGIVPDLVVATALLENDLGQGRTVAQMQASLKAFITSVQNHFPKARIILGTPHPSFSYNTNTIKDNYHQIRDYILSLDDNKTIYVARMDGYENGADSTHPYAESFTGSISGTTLTVTVAPTTPMFLGERISNSVQADYGTITAFGTGTGGTGTYTLSVNSGTVASGSLIADVYTDNTVHPNFKAAYIQAKAIANTIRRMGTNWKLPYATVSNNIALDGTATATGTNVSGTVPTSTSIQGASGATFVGTAEQPYFKETITQPSGSTVVDIAATNFGSITIPTGAKQISSFVKVVIVSGAANLRVMQLEPRVNDGGGNTFQSYISLSSTDADGSYSDGDTLTFRTPPMVANSGAITSVTNYLRVHLKPGGGTVVYRVLSQGVGILSNENLNYLPNGVSINVAKITADATNTATGTTGNQTINKPSGTVNIAAGGSSITVTNSLVTTSSIVMAVIRTNDATAVIKNVVPASGSFTINLNAATTAETSIGFIVYN